MKKKNSGNKEMRFFDLFLFIPNTCLVEASKYCVTMQVPQQSEGRIVRFDWPFSGTSTVVRSRVGRKKPLSASDQRSELSHTGYIEFSFHFFIHHHRHRGQRVTDHEGFHCCRLHRYPIRLQQGAQYWQSVRAPVVAPILDNNALPVLACQNWLILPASTRQY